MTSSFIHLYYVQFPPFLRPNNIPLYVFNIWHVLFIHSLVNGHLVFHRLAIMNNTAVNIGVKITETLLWIILSICPEVVFLGHMIILILIFWDTTILFFTTAAPAMHMSSGFSTSLLMYYFLFIYFFGVSFCLKSPWFSISPYHIQWAWTYLISAYFSNLILCPPLAFLGHKTLPSLGNFYCPSLCQDCLHLHSLWIVAYYFGDLDLHKGCKCVCLFSLSPSTLLFPLKHVSSSVTISSLLVSYPPSVESQLCEDKTRGFLHSCLCRVW